MKFCPYCGADLLDDAAVFCVECGKTLPSQTDSESVPAPKGKLKKRKTDKKKSHKKSGAHTVPHEPAPAEKNNDGYDGYYDDIIPADNGNTRQALDKTLIKKTVALIVGLLLVVGACVAIMYLL